MPEELWDKALQRYLSDELKVVNAHLPRHRKPLSELLSEDYPQVICNDGDSQSFKRKELEYLSGLLNEEERQVLLLPILIEITPDSNESIVLCSGVVEEKIVSAILAMSPTKTQRGIRMYRPQLSVLRRILKTTTQYVFVHPLT